MISRVGRARMMAMVGIMESIGPSDSDAILSVAGYPRWITLFFTKGRTLQDPTGLLQGDGSTIRSIRLGSPADLDRPEVLALISQAIHPQLSALAAAPPLRALIKSISAKQRPRRKLE